MKTKVHKLTSGSFLIQTSDAPMCITATAKMEHARDPGNVSIGFFSAGHEATVFITIPLDFIEALAEEASGTRARLNMIEISNTKE